MNSLSNLRLSASIAFIAALALASGCATSRTAGINTTQSNVAAIRNIVQDRSLVRLDDYQGIALVQLGKIGAVGFGAMGETVAVFVRDPKTKQFGPPFFSNYGGLSVGLAYGGLNVVDCVVLFASRERAIAFADRPIAANFSNEATFLWAGRKQMTISGGDSYSHGVGLALGCVELEVLVGAPRTGLHSNMYQGETSARKILLGEVTVPPELKQTLQQLDMLGKE